MSSLGHPVAPTTTQRDADYHYSQQLTKLQDEIMDLNKIIGNTAADHRREAHPLYPSFLLKDSRQSLGTSARNDLSQHEDTVAHVQTRSDSQGGQYHSGEDGQAFPRDCGVLYS